VVGACRTLSGACAADRVAGADPGVYRKARCSERATGLEALACRSKELLRLGEIAAGLPAVKRRVGARLGKCCRPDDGKRLALQNDAFATNRLP
jgi:hypothetical protein